MDAYDRLFANVGDRIAGAHGLRDRARSALAQDALRYAAAAADRAESPAPYLDLATEVWPASRQWRSTARVVARAERAGRTGRAGYGAVVRRIARRGRVELMYLRWATSGL